MAHYGKLSLLCVLILFTFSLFLPALAFAGPPQAPVLDRTRQLQLVPKSQLTVPKSFRVGKVTFQQVSNNNQKFLAVAVEFNHPVDRISIIPGNNFRLMKESNGFWIDAYPVAGSNLRVINNVVTWIMGTPVVEGNHKMHLRGTIRDTSGAYLDCNNDGVPEGGNLPAYDSQIYHIGSIPLELIEKP
ncbi:MAG: hypothetical protein C0622_12705 [Desulfuromonas sp.]|nr:MAG: hypothetical protein C0622_12705 [Desulfuromonas sp.]